MKFSIDLELIQDRELQELDCLMYAIADSLAQKGQFKLKYDNFAKLINRNKQAVVNGLDRLAKAGYIEYKIQNSLLNISIVSVQQQLEVMQYNQQKINEAKAAKKAKSKPNDEELQIIKDVIGYLNQKMNSNFRTNTNANQKLIIALLHKGYKQPDFIKVIDNKYIDWHADSYWAKYMRPSTLFQASKFDGYLNEQHKTAAENKMEKYKAPENDSIEGWS